MTKPCPLCQIAPERILHANDHAVAIDGAHSVWLRCALPTPRVP